MGRYVLRRLMMFVPTTIAVAILIFLMIDLVPGDPVAMMLGLEASPEARAQLRIDMGLDRPLPVRMVEWFGRAIRGDLGTSIFQHEPVTQILAERYPVTISMTFLSLLVAMGVGVSTGIFAAVHQGRVADWIAMVLALTVLSIPLFWFALNLIYLFGVSLRWFPIGGYVAITKNPGEFFVHMFLPCMTLGLGYAAMIARMTRTAMLEVLGMDYVRTARAKGLLEQVVIVKHAFRNALIPVLTVIGLAAGGLLGGSVVTEMVFNLPGVGRLVAEAVKRRDYPVVQGGILAVTLTYLLINLVVDLIYARVDPRIRYD